MYTYGYMYIFTELEDKIKNAVLSSFKLKIKKYPHSVPLRENIVFFMWLLANVRAEYYKKNMFCINLLYV
jgi:hypothetical protein